MTSHTRARPWWLAAALFGLATLAFGAWFSGIIPANGCLLPPRSGVSALLAYQMARTPADVEAVFGKEGDVCRAGMVAALDRANRLDLMAFIGTYGLFLAAFLMAMIRDGGERAARVGLFTLIAGIGFDVLETSTQLRITRELPGSQPNLLALAIGSFGKYTMLALVGIFAGLAMLARGGSMGRIAGVLCIAGALASLAGLIDARAIGLLTIGTALSWLAMLAYAVAAALGAGREREIRLR